MFKIFIVFVMKLEIIYGEGVMELFGEGVFWS